MQIPNNVLFPKFDPEAKDYFSAKYNDPSPEIPEVYHDSIASRNIRLRFILKALADGSNCPWRLFGEAHGSISGNSKTLVFACSRIQRENGLAAVTVNAVGQLLKISFVNTRVNPFLKDSRRFFFVSLFQSIRYFVFFTSQILKQS